eukprot:Em0102g3a
MDTRLNSYRISLTLAHSVYSKVEEIKRLQRDAYNFQPVLELQNYFTQYRLTLIMSSTPFPTSWNPRWWSTDVPPDPAPPPISAPPHPTSPSSSPTANTSALTSAASLTCKCGSDYLPETDSALAECNRTTASCQGAGTCALAATLTAEGIVQSHWFCLSGAPDREFVTKSLCHGANVTPRDHLVYLCCSNYSMCNADLKATFVTNVRPTSTLPDPTQLSNRSDSIPSVFMVTAAITSSLLTLLILLAFLSLLTITLTIRARRSVTTVDDVAMDTITSGSGLGKPYLVKRTFSRRINLKDISLGHGRFGKVTLGSYQKEAVAVKRFLSTGMDSWLHETQVFDLCMHHEAIVGFVASDTYCLDGCNEYWLVTCYHPHGMASTACSGLAHLHVPLVGFKGKPPIAHRDIKSANILVKDDLTCCLADMGLAFVGGRKGEPPPIMPPSLSRWDLGTRRYLSPEILCAHQCHPMSAQRQVQHYIMSDVYAMALVIWEMCRRTVTKEGDCDPCAVPYEGMVPSDPSVEDMRKVVCSMKKRPPISERWNNDQPTCDIMVSVSLDKTLWCWLG